MWCGQVCTANRRALRRHRETSDLGTGKFLANGQEKKKIALITKQTPPSELLQYFADLLKEYPYHTKDMTDFLTENFSTPSASSFASRTKAVGLAWRVFFYVPTEGEDTVVRRRPDRTFKTLKGI